MRRLTKLMMIKAKSKKAQVGKPFEKGVSGNPGGRPKIPTEIRQAFREAAQEYSVEALEVIAAAMRNKKASLTNRLKAANYLLDRGIGKPIAYQDVLLEDRTAFEDRPLTIIERARGLGFMLSELERERKRNAEGAADEAVPAADLGDGFAWYNRSKTENI